MLMAWDPEAYARLQLVASLLRDDGVVDLLHEVVRQVWKYNVDRHEPSLIGDTNRSLGFTTSENIRSLVPREVNTTFRREGLAESVRVSTAGNSLLIHAAGGPAPRGQSPGVDRANRAPLGRVRLGERKRSSIGGGA